MPGNQSLVVAVQFGREKAVCPNDGGNGETGFDEGGDTYERWRGKVTGDQVRSRENGAMDVFAPRT